MKNLKKLLSTTLVLALVISLSACKSSTTTANTNTKKEITVAGVVFQEDQFMKLLSLGYQDAAKAAGVKCLTSNTGNDQAKEAELINTYLTQKVDGLAISPLNSDSSIATLKKASEKGMKIAITNLPLTNAPFVVGGFTSDNINLGATTGKAAAKFIKEKFNGKAKIAIVEYKSLIAQQSGDRVNGFLQEVKKENPNVEVVADQDAWLQDKAVSVAGDILTAHPDVDIIFGANDGGTIGSVMAVKNAGKAGKCFVFGIDVGDQQLAMLKDENNILQAVTGQDPYDIGYKAMELLIKNIKGEVTSASNGEATIVPGVAVSRDDPSSITKFETDLAAKMAK